MTNPEGENQNRSDTSERLNLATINTLIQNLSGKPLREDVQEQLARIRSFLDAWWEGGQITADFIPPLQAAIAALSASPPNLLLAQSILWDLEFYLSHLGGGFNLGRILMIISGGWPMAVVILGLLASLFAFGPIFLLLVALHIHEVLTSVLDDALIAAAFFGVLGGAVSLLTRIKRPLDLVKLNPISVFLNCLSKPLIGAVFAIVVYFMLKSDLLAGALTTGANDHKFIYLASVIAFATGFSERFAVDAIADVESTVARNRTSGVSRQ